jgi:tripartite-type tricarboxylate transporter receptor subunit TctC
VIRRHDIGRLRRPFLRRAAGCLAALAALAAVPKAWADDWPTRPVTILVNGGPGSLPDLFARPLAERLHKALGQPVVVENKPGAGGMLAMQQLKSAPTDGHTLALVTNAHLVWNPYIFPALTYDPARDLLPVSPLAVIPMALTVNDKMPAQSLDQLLALARKQPGKLNYASSGNGSPPHVLFEMLREQAGVDIVHVPFKTGTGALNSVLAGDTQMYLAGTALVEPMVKDGRLRALAISEAVPDAAFGKTPTLAQSGLRGFEGAVWLGVAASAGTPDAIVQRLNAEIGRAQQDGALKQMYASHGSLPYHLAPAAFAQRVAAERDASGPVLRKLGIKPD